MFADMHIHSIYSDGTNTPRELVEMAKRNCVSIIAISDHDTIDGIKQLK
jgi:predicted metal-dependent phosphoesterase TrpH